MFHNSLTLLGGRKRLRQSIDEILNIVFLIILNIFIFLTTFNLGKGKKHLRQSIDEFEIIIFHVSGEKLILCTIRANFSKEKGACGRV